MKNFTEWQTDKTEERALLEHCKTVINRLLPGATVILYGSRARGEAKSESDYDLLILVDGEVSSDLENMIGNALYEVELEWEVVIPAFIFDRKSWDHKQFRASPFHQNVDREGVVL
ncbi:MAG: nucleotidyltransferase domain-containing protein [bacterium]